MSTKVTRKENLFASVDDLNEIRLKRSSANEEPIDVSHLGKLLARPGRYGASVNDASRCRNVGTHMLLQPLSELGMNFLGLKSKSPVEWRAPVEVHPDHKRFGNNFNNRYN